MLVRVIHAKMAEHVAPSMEMLISVFVLRAQQASIVKFVSMFLLYLLSRIKVNVY